MSRERDEPGHRSTKGKKEVSADDQTSEELQALAMRKVNSILQTLSALAQANWSPTNSYVSIPNTGEVERGHPRHTVARVSALVENGREKLETLRSLGCGLVEVERGAGSLMGKALALGLHDVALRTLQDMHTALVSICNSEFDNVMRTTPEPVLSMSTEESCITLLSITGISSSRTLDSNVQELVCAYFSHALTLSCHVIARSQKSATCSTLSTALSLSNSNGPLTWIDSIPELPKNKKDRFLKHAYLSLTSSFSSVVLPPVLLQIKLGALSFLSRTSNIDVKAFWEQVIKTCNNYIKANHLEGKGTETITMVLKGLNNVTSDIRQNRKVASRLLSGDSWLSFCEFWLALAVKSGNGNFLPDISRHIQKLLSGSQSDRPDDTRMVSKQDLARVCVTLAHTAAVFENLDIYGPDKERHNLLTSVHCSEAAMKHCVSVLSSSTDELVHNRVRRSLEKLRRAIVKALICSNQFPFVNLLATQLLQSLVHALHDILKSPNMSQSFRADVIVSALDSLFNLATHTLDVNDVDACEASIKYLRQAVQLVETVSVGDHGPYRHATVEDNQDDYLRCISGTSFNIAGALYKACKFGQVVTLLRDSNPIADQALRLYREALRRNREALRHTEAWNQFKLQLHKRWELLGVCYMKMNDRINAHHAFVESLKRYYFSHSLEGVLQQMRSCDAYKLAAYHPLGALIDRLTYLGAVDLFLQKETSLLRPLQGVGLQDICIGAVLERQIESLEASKQNSQIQHVIGVLLDDLVTIYSNEHPVRKAKVMLRVLEHAYQTGNDSVVVLEIGKEILRLLVDDNIGKDVSLAAFKPEYIVASHFWLAVHAHRRGSFKFDNIVHHASEIAQLLRRMAITPKLPLTKQYPRKDVATLVQSSVVNRPKAVQQKKNVVKTVELTPLHCRKESYESVLLGAPIQPKHLLSVDDFETLTAQLQLLTRLLGLNGLLPSKLDLLDSIRIVSKQQKGIGSECYWRSSIDLAEELVKIGKTTKGNMIYEYLISLLRQGLSPSDSWTVRLLLRSAESCVILGDTRQSQELYQEASHLAETLPGDDVWLTVSVRMHARIDVLARAALATTVFAGIQHANKNLPRSLEHSLLALRLFNSSIEALARMKTLKSRLQHGDDLSVATGPKDAPSAFMRPMVLVEEVNKGSRLPARPLADSIEWEIVEGILHTLLTISRLYIDRGSPREAEYFADEAHKLAQSVKVPAMISCALTRKGEILLYLGQSENAQENILQALQHLDGLPSAELADIRRLQGDYSTLIEGSADAFDLYDDASSTLSEVDSMLAALDSDIASSSGPCIGGAAASSDPFAPSILASILSRHIWLLRDDLGDRYQKLMDRFLALPSLSDVQAEKSEIFGRMALHDVLGRFRGDMFLNSLSDSTIAIPMFVMSNTGKTLTGSTRDIDNALIETERLLLTGLQIFFESGKSTYIRQLAMSLVLVRAFHVVLGYTDRHTSGFFCNLLDISSSLTLRREFLENIGHKFTNTQSRADALWPPIHQPKTSEQNLFSDDSLPQLDIKKMTIVSATDPEVSSRYYWEFIRNKYEKQATNPASLLTADIDILPVNWTVINISVTEDTNTLLVARRRPHQESLTFCIPFNGRRDGEHGEHFSFKDGIRELKDILKASDQNTQKALDIRKDDKPAKANWWVERKQLDRRMKELLQNIEFCWFGAFKTIFSEPLTVPPEVMATLQTQLNKVLKDNLGSHEKKLKANIKLDTCFIECFASLAPDCRDEELEDFVYLILDLYHFNGIPIAPAELDVEQFSVDLRVALEEHHSKNKSRVRTLRDNHLFLVLDKNVQGIPWESIPVLRGKSVSRIPSASFLVDRMQFERSHDAHSSSNSGISSDYNRIDPANAFFVLNPGGDLMATEGRFIEWVKRMKTAGWDGIVGKKPSEQQMLNALSQKDLVIYFGHGGAEHIARPHKVRRLPRCAATMLWGCSSGALQEMGAFDRVGTPHNYIMAGCPTLIANLWDVTDRDIDILTQGVLDKLRLDANYVKRRRPYEKSDDGAVSVVSAVAQSRNLCKLRYLTGAATVVYGIPFYL